MWYKLFSSVSWTPTSQSGMECWKNLGFQIVLSDGSTMEPDGDDTMGFKS